MHPARIHCAPQPPCRVAPHQARPASPGAPLARGRSGHTGVAWAAVLGVLALKWRDAESAELRQNTKLARALEAQTVRVLATADQASKCVRDAVLAGHAAAQDLVRFANETGLAPGILVQLSLVDAHGRFMGCNLDPDGKKTANLDLSSREHVRIHLTPQVVPEALRLKSPELLFIGKPVLGKVSQRWTIQLSRRIATPDGPLLGVVVASLDPGHFEKVYQRVALGSLGGMTLVGTDLNIRARVIGGQSVGMGSSLTEQSGFRRLAVNAEGHFTSTSTLDGVQRLASYRWVADCPLCLLVSTAVQETMAEWRTTHNEMLGLTALLSLAVALGTVIFVVSLQRLERTHAALRASEAQANSANQAKSEFLAAISHELRTPLTSIRGFAELMEHRLEQPRFKETAGLIRKGAEHLNELLSQILDLAKAEAGAMALQPEAAAPRPLLQGTVDSFALSASAKGLGLTLRRWPTTCPTAAMQRPAAQAGAGQPAVQRHQVHRRRLTRCVCVVRQTALVRRLARWCSTCWTPARASPRHCRA